MSRMYLILAVAGWVWLVVALAAVRLVRGRRRGVELVEADEKQS